MAVTKVDMWDARSEMPQVVRKVESMDGSLAVALAGTRAAKWVSRKVAGLAAPKADSTAVLSVERKVVLRVVRWGGQTAVSLAAVTAVSKVVPWDVRTVE